MSGRSYSDWTRERACTRKRAYQSRMVAGNVATALGWAGREGLEPYQCRFCGFWHVGHRNGHQQRQQEQTR